MGVASILRRSLEAVNAVGKSLEEAVEDAVPLLGIDLLGQVHRSLHIGEEHHRLDGDRGLLSYVLHPKSFR
jgi:hypothetical protein